VSKTNNKCKQNTKKQGRNYLPCFGFSLIEILVVITIIGVLSAAGLVFFTRAGVSARDGRRKTDLEQLRSALVLYRTDNAAYPASTSFTTMMAAINTYISVTSMQDPLGGSRTYTYTATNGTKGFSICATLENPTPTNPNPYCITNP